MIKKCQLLFVVAFLLTLLCSGGEPKAKTVSLKINHTECSPVIDGKINGNEWRDSTETVDFSGPINGHSPSIFTKAEYLTTARMAWDENFLYVLFVCRQPGKVFADRTVRDDRLYGQDVAEVYLDVAGDMMQYAEIHFSPLGTQGDILHRWKVKPDYPPQAVDDSLRKHHSYDSGWDLKGMKSAGGVLMENGKKTGWIVEAAIPLGPLFFLRGLPEKAVAECAVRLNLLRYLYLPGKDGKREHYQANLSPTQKGRPHVSPSAMVTVTLTDGQKE